MYICAPVLDPTNCHATSFTSRLLQRGPCHKLFFLGRPEQMFFGNGPSCAIRPGFHTCQKAKSVEILFAPGAVLLYSLPWCASLPVTVPGGPAKPLRGFAHLGELAAEAEPDELGLLEEAALEELELLLAPASFFSTLAISSATSIFFSFSGSSGLRFQDLTSAP